MHFRYCLKPILTLFLLMGATKLTAQNANNSLLYSNQANILGDQTSVGDPISVIMPGTALSGGFGSFMDNPAGASLFGESFGEFGISYNTIDERAQYLDRSRTADQSQTRLSNFGFVYRFPTIQGSFVIGAGYAKNNLFNRALAFSARNNGSTITDNFKTPGSSYSGIAFNTYATDYGDEFEDWDESILRAGFDNYGEYLGIYQHGEITQSGHGGEYSAFFGTEFQKNLMLGVSVGLLSGNFRYDRIFQEIDEMNDYGDAFIDSNDDGTGDTDIDNILLDERLTSRYNGFKARAGVIYKVADHLNIGASYTFPTRINIEETFDAAIETTLDNGVVFEDDTGSEFTYYVEFPSRTSLGFAVDNMNGVSLSVSADYVDYSATRIDFDDSSLFEEEQNENEFIERDFRSVWNLKSGIAFDVNRDFTLRAGYGYQPSRFAGGEDHKTILSAGLGFSISPEMRIEFAVQHTMWEEESAVYEYGVYDYSSLPDAPPEVSFRSEDAFREAGRWQGMATLRVNFD